MGTITYKPVFALSPSLDDILGAPRRQVAFNDASLVYEVTGGAWAGCRIVYSGINLEYEDRNIPDPLSQVMQVNITWNSQILFGFSYPRVSLFDLLLSSDGVDNALTLLQGSTYGGANTFNGTDGADRLTAYRSGDTLNGGGGDDRFWDASAIRS
jgi:Ca2+-binding RTX toxin-like protein